MNQSTLNIRVIFEMAFFGLIKFCFFDFDSYNRYRITFNVINALFNIFFILIVFLQASKKGLAKLDKIVRFYQ